MIELYYDAFDLACILYSQNMSIKTTSRMLQEIWQQDNLYFIPYYRTNWRALYLDVQYWMNYLCNKPVIDKEFPSVQKDFHALGREVDEEAYITEYSDINLFFKMKRLQILYLGGQDFSKIKLRTMLKRYGYKRRTRELLRYFRECLMFYHMQTYLRGKEECDIGAIGLDEMVMLRVI